MNRYNDHPKPTGARPPRRWFRFSLRTLLCVVTVLALWLGFQVGARRQAAAVKAMQGWFAAVRVSYHDSPELFVDLSQSLRQGGFKTFDYPDDPPWLVGLCGVDLLHSVVGVAVQPFADPAGKRQFLDVDLAPLSQLTELKQLHLYGVPALRLTNDGLHHLANLSKLESLTLGLDGVDDSGLEHLSRLTKLRRLRLESSRVHGEGLRHLAAMNELNYLQLGHQITDEGLLNFPATLTNLTTLSLGDNKISGPGLTALEHCDHVTALDLPNNLITDEGLSHLPQMDKLESLYFDKNRLSGSGLAHLKNQPSLTSLSLAQNPITDAGLEHLQKIASLESVDLRGTQVTAEGVQRLHESRPTLWIECDFGAIRPPRQPPVPPASP